MKSVQLFLAIPLIFASLIFVGCPPPPAEITLIPSWCEINVNDSLQCSASSTAQESGFSWLSSNPNIATISASGLLTGEAPGSVTITATGLTSGEQAQVVLWIVRDDAFNESLTPDPEKIKPSMERKVSMESCQFTISIPDIAATEYKWGDRRYHKLRLYDAGLTDEEGCPELPFFSLLVARPLDAQTGEPLKPTITVTPSNESRLDGIYPYPVQPPAWEQAGQPSLPTPVFQYDPEVYTSAGPYPQADYKAEEFQIGNLHLMRIKVYPVKAYPAKHGLVLNKRIEVDVNFGATPAKAPYLLGDITGTGAIAETRLAPWIANSDIVELLDIQYLNTQLAPIDTVHVNDSDFQMLIITRPEFYAQAFRLGRHRQDLGWRVYLASLSETTYPTPLSIRDYITAMDVANTVPVTGRSDEIRCMNSILLIGDSEFIPAWVGLNTGLNPNPTDPAEELSTLGTDLYYGAIRGADYFPDVPVGRISVDTSDEAKYVIDKIIQYDSLATTSNHIAVYGEFQDDVTAQADLTGTVIFYTNGIIANGIDTLYNTEVNAGEFIRLADPEKEVGFSEIDTVDNNTKVYFVERTDTGGSGDGQVGWRDGQADRPFIDTTERVRRFMEDLGVTVRWAYGRTEGPAPALFEDGTALPAELLAYAWNGDGDDVRDNWQQGLDAIILHRDHAGSWWWSTPEFFAGMLGPMTDPSTAIYPFVLSINCQSGWYDNEVDQLRTSTGLIDDTSTSVNSESFCEQILRMEEGGAVAIFGASRNSQSGPNDTLTDGVFKSFYPDYMPGALLPTWGDFSHPEIGYATMYAKIFVALRRDTPEKGHYYLELFNLFGDPLTTLNLPE